MRAIEGGTQTDVPQAAQWTRESLGVSQCWRDNSCTVVHVSHEAGPGWSMHATLLPIASFSERLCTYPALLVQQTKNRLTQPVKETTFQDCYFQ